MLDYKAVPELWTPGNDAPPAWASGTAYPAFETAGAETDRQRVSGCLMRTRSGVKPWETPQSTAWLRVATFIFR